MKFALIICTYMRPKSLQILLESVRIQTLYPDEILIVDGSTNDETSAMLESNHYQNLRYFKVSDDQRGLTKQRNVGIDMSDAESEILCFLDDDTILDSKYFEHLLATYNRFPNALGVSGYITNEGGAWKYMGDHYRVKIDEYYFDGFIRPDSSRNILRKKLNLISDVPPGFMPTFSHGRSTGYLPPTGKTYRVEQMMGGVSSFKRSVFENIRFSTFFEGYGLYEDADFTLRVSKIGSLYVNTAAKVEHHHDSSGRPNMFKYGEMVVRNGYYVWRVGHPDPDLKSKLKWHAITLLLTGIRFVNIFTTAKRKEAASETFGRLSAYVKLFFNAPKP